MPWNAPSPFNSTATLHDTTPGHFKQCSKKKVWLESYVGSKGSPACTVLTCQLFYPGCSSQPPRPAHDTASGGDPPTAGPPSLSQRQTLAADRALAVPHLDNDGDHKDGFLTLTSVMLRMAIVTPVTVNADNANGNTDNNDTAVVTLNSDDTASGDIISALNTYPLPYYCQRT